MSSVLSENTTTVAAAEDNATNTNGVSKRQQKKLLRKEAVANKDKNGAPSKRADAEASGPSKGFAGLSQRDEKRLYTTFTSRKQLWLSEIEKHSAPIDSSNRDEADKSNKGFIDQRCLAIIALLNAHPDYVTTSSCSGRICLFHTIGNLVDDSDGMREGEPVEAAASASATENSEELRKENETKDEEEKMKRGAEGSLGWILASHDSPLSEEQIQLVLRHTVPSHVSPPTTAEKLSDSESVAALPEAIVTPSSSGGIPTRGQVSLKCEPFLLHVQCRTIEAAKKLLNAASEAGFRNSGMIPPGKNIMVGIRHASLSIDCPLVADGGVSFASEPYVRYLVKVAEEKMAENFRRTLLLEKCIDRWICNSQEEESKPASQ